MNTLAINKVSYQYGKNTKIVLDNVSAKFEQGVLYCIVGKSGAGKSTLLSLISGLDLATGGTILYGGNDLAAIDRDEYRAKNIGVIFQGYNLLTNCTAVENIVLSMNISGQRDLASNGACGRRTMRGTAYMLLEKVGIDRETADRKILKLSGGEQQRVGIARALSHNPDIVIADEPTGNLDGGTAEGIMDIFVRLARGSNIEQDTNSATNINLDKSMSIVSGDTPPHEEGKCVIVVTHSKDVAAYADEILTIENGKLERR